MESIILVYALFFSGPTLLDHECTLLHKHYVQMGVIEDKENYFFYKWRLDSDIDTIEYRISKITPDTLPVEAKYTLPPLVNCIAAWELQYAFELYLDSIYDISSVPDRIQIDLIRDDLKWRKDLWEEIIHINSLGFYDDKGVRIRLTELRDKVGRSNFEKGIWAHPLPLAAQNSTFWPVDYKPMEEP